VPRQYSTGGRATLPGISKRGDRHLRSLLVQGARAVLRCANRRTDALGSWLQALLRRRHTDVVGCVLANKMARIVGAILARGGEYRGQSASRLISTSRLLLRHQPVMKINGTKVWLKT
jgi:hypothetical protein